MTHQGEFALLQPVDDIDIDDILQADRPRGNGQQRDAEAGGNQAKHSEYVARILDNMRLKPAL